MHFLWRRPSSISPRNFPPYRQLVTLLVFTLSGIAHAIGSWTIGPMCDMTSTPTVACSDGLRSGNSRTWSGGVFSVVVAGRRWRVFGYIWVWVYLAWSLPKLLFLNAACS